MRIRFHWQNQRFSDSMQLRLRETPEQQWETVSWEWDFLLRILGGLAVTGQFMRDKRWMETEDIILGKAKYEDWRSKALALSCGLVYQYSEQKTDQRNGKAYEMEIYKKNLRSTGSGK